jgi:hypothetical protein
MPHVYADRVREVFTGTGPGNITLQGAVLGFRSFLAGVGVGNTTDVCAVDPVTGEWEVFATTLLSATSLQRGTLLASSTGGRVSFTSGTKEVFVCLPGSEAMRRTEIEAELDALAALVAARITDAPAGGGQHGRVAGAWQRQDEALQFQLSDRETALATGVRGIYPWPFAHALDEVFLGVGTVSSSGIVRVDLRVAGASIFTTRPAIAAGQDTNLTGGGTISVLTSLPFTIAKGTMVTFQVDDAGTGAKELVVTCNGRRA